MKKSLLKIICLALSLVLLCSLFAGCGKNDTTSGAISSDILSESSATSDTSETSSESNAATSSNTIGTGGIILAPEVKNVPAVWTEARPTITWTALKDGVTAHVIVESADGKVYAEKSGITATSYTLEKDLKSGTTYTLKVFYNYDGNEFSMSGITKSGKKIVCTIEKSAVTMSSIVTKMKNSSDYQIMMVGDSITYGTGSREDYPQTGDSTPDDEKTYVAVFTRLLAQKLTNKTVVRYDGTYTFDSAKSMNYINKYNGPVTVQSGSGGKITVVRSGIGGNTVARLIKRKSDFLGKAVAGKAADLFIIKSGINDALYHVDNEGQKRVEPDVYKENLNTLLTEIAKSNPDADVILMTPTVDDDHTKKATSQLDIYATKMKEVAAEWGVPVIDLHKLWMDHIDPTASNYGLGDWLTGRTGDLCHPSPKGHEAIAKEMIRAIFG